MHVQAKELLLSKAMALQPDAPAVKCPPDYAASRTQEVLRILTRLFASVDIRLCLITAVTPASAASSLARPASCWRQLQHRKCIEPSPMHPCTD